MDMAARMMVMTMTRKKSNDGLLNKFLWIFGLSALLLEGCKPGAQEINEELAKQIAVDAIGLKSSDQESVSCQNNEDGGYQVTFSTEKGVYSVGVSANGKVETYQFKKHDDSEQTDENTSDGDDQNGENINESDDQPTDQTSDQSETTAEEDTHKDSESSGEADSENMSTTDELPENSLSREELIRKAAEHLEEKEVKDENYSLEVRDDGQIDIQTTTSDGRHYTITMNPQTGQVTYTKYSY